MFSVHTVLYPAQRYKKAKIVEPENYANEKNNIHIAHFAFSQNKFWAAGFAAQCYNRFYSSITPFLKDV